MKKRLIVPGLLVATAAIAGTPTANSPFYIRQANSANSGNHATGDIVVWGIQDVQPPADMPGAYVYGTSGICPAGLTCGAFATDPSWIKQRLFERDWTLLPHQYYGSRPYDASLTGAWRLLLSTNANFSGAVSITTPTLGNVDAMPFVNSMTISGAGLTPTISWTLPASTPDGIDQMRIRVQDVTHPVTVESRNGPPTSFQQSDLIWQSPVLTSTSFTLPAGVLQYGTSYAISIDLAHTRTGGVFAGTVDARSSSYFDFTPINPATLPAGVTNIALPTLTPVPTTSGLLAGPVYGFNVGSVGPNQVTFIDPVVAVGFSYATGAGDPNFKTVQVPSSVGDGLYEVWTWDGSAWQLSAADLAAGASFDFTAHGFTAGVDRFQIRGIEASAAVNAFDVTGFVTGLTFVADGSFTGTMQAITADVPEPATWALWLLGAGGLLTRRWRQT
ncbi:MAG: PEP-CTERM sorting domain-containing protein [Pelomonas sp.]|nr:PEP-CTERM sorting domain-containing protein [Roseateles sp.]